MFHPSGAGTLRTALAQAGRNEDVVTHHDSFAFGPIKPPDPKIRADWVGESLGYDDWEEVSATVAPFLAQSLSPEVLPLAWFSRRDAHTFTGFLEWLWQLDDAPCEVVDVSELRLSRGGQACLVLSPSLITADEFNNSGILDGVTRLGEQDRAAFRDLWSSLRAENAPMRVVGETGLKSARLDLFDPLILSHADSKWRKMGLIVGCVLDDQTDAYRQSGDLLLASRVRALAEAGKLQWRGDLYEMRNCEIRLPQGA